MSLVAEQEPLGEEFDDEVSFTKRRTVTEDTEMDITPMIDITFLLLIFFLVASVPDPQVAVMLPEAVMGDKVDPQVSTVITMAVNPANKEQAEVYLSDGRRPEGYLDQRSGHEQAIVSALKDAMAQNKTFVIIKAERDVQNGEINRVMDFIAKVEGITPYLAVLEDN